MNAREPWKLKSKTSKSWSNCSMIKRGISVVSRRMSQTWKCSMSDTMLISRGWKKNTNSCWTMSTSSKLWFRIVEMNLPKLSFKSKNKTTKSLSFPNNSRLNWLLIPRTCSLWSAVITNLTKVMSLTRCSVNLLTILAVQFPSRS